MQAVLNEQFHFAGGRDYMMRSEKRSGGPAHRSSTPGGKKPHRKRRRAGFFYKLLMVILLVTIWPLGLLMLWQRKVRWGVLTKLLTSVVTLAVCIMLLGFALTVNTNIPQYTAVQDKVNHALNIAADYVVDGAEIAAEKAQYVYAGVTDFADALWEGGKVHLANLIDEGVLLAQDVKADVLALINKDAEPAAETETTPAIELTPEATAEATVEPTLEPTPTPQPTATPEPETPTFIVKSAEDAIVYYNDGGKCYHMTSACASMKSSVEHTFGETRDVNNHRCSICGTPEKTMLDEEYIIWLDGEGSAHLTDECSDFVGSWKLITAESAIEDGAVACMNCEADLYMAALAVDQEIIIERPAEPTPEPTEAPTEQPTEEPTEEPTEAPAETSAEESAMTLSDAEAPAAAEEEDTEIKTTAMPELVSEAPAEEPTEAPTEEPTEVPTEEPTEVPTEEPTEVPTEAPTEAPTEEPTPEPTPQVVVPAAALKGAGRAMLYCGEDGKTYHLKPDCTALTGSSRVSEFEDCVLTMQPCAECGAPAAEYTDLPCLWKDEKDLCHTADTCAAFQGTWNLIPRDEALAQSLLPCSECGADEYLLPGTEIDYAAIVTPTPIPTTTPNPNAFVYTDILVVDAA